MSKTTAATAAAAAAEVAEEVRQQVAQKIEAYHERYSKPSAATVKKWKRRATAEAEMKKFQLSFDFGGLTNE